MLSDDPGSSSPFIVLSGPRDTGDFSAAGDPYVDGSLSMFERLSTHNSWDGTLMLANVAFWVKEMMTIN